MPPGSSMPSPSGTKALLAWYLVDSSSIITIKSTSLTMGTAKYTFGNKKRSIHFDLFKQSSICTLLRLLLWMVMSISRMEMSGVESINGPTLRTTVCSWSSLASIAMACSSTSTTLSIVLCDMLIESRRSHSTVSMQHQSRWLDQVVRD